MARPSGVGVEEVCFKELYVASSAESGYAGAGANAWSRDNQVPLSLVTGFLRSHGAVKEAELPWGSPVYAVRRAGRPLRVAAYTEPSVYWERAHGLCRSWNLMADGTCYATLETPDSLVTFDGWRLAADGSRRR